jgi:hypothetical protein
VSSIFARSDCSWLAKCPPTVTLFFPPRVGAAEDLAWSDDDDDDELMIEASSLTNALDDDSNRSVASRGSSSLFFSTNPSVSYSTSPA